MITPQIMATNKMQDPVSPLGILEEIYDDTHSDIYDDMAAKYGFLDGGSSPTEAAKDTTVAVDATSKDQTKQKLPTQDPVSPLVTYDTAAKDGDSVSVSSPAEAAKDTTVAMVANSDIGSLKLPTRDLLPYPDNPDVGINNGTGPDGESFTMPVNHEAAQGSNDPAEQTENITEENHKPTNDDLLDEACADYRAEIAVSDSGSHMSPNPDTVLPSVKGKQSTKRRTKATIDPDNLPSKDDELSEAQIASLCYQPPRVRQGYTRYFATAGTIRAAYSGILMERLPNGELRFSEEILRSCLPKWKDRKDLMGSSELGDSAQTGSGPSRKRKGAATSAKRVADEDIGPQRKTKKRKNEQLPVNQGDTGHVVPAEPRRPLRIRSVITPRTAFSMGLPPSAISSKPPTALQAGSSESFPSEALKARHSQQPQVQNQPSQIATSNINPSAVPNSDNRKSFCGNFIPTQGTRVHNYGSCQLLDPNHLSQFAQYLTGEIQQLDLTIVSIAHGSHDQGRRYALRHLRDVLIDLRDLCVDMEIEQRSLTVTKSRDDMGDV